MKTTWRPSYLASRTYDWSLHILDAVARMVEAEDTLRAIGAGEIESARDAEMIAAASKSTDPNRKAWS